MSLITLLAKGLECWRLTVTPMHTRVHRHNLPEEDQTLWPLHSEGHWKGKCTKRQRPESLHTVILTITSFQPHFKYCSGLPPPSPNQSSNLVFPCPWAVGWQDKAASFTWTCDENCNYGIKLRTQQSPTVCLSFSTAS